MVRSVPFFLLQKGVEGCCRKMLVLFGCKITACECECRIDVAERPMPVNLGHTCWNALPNMAIDHPPFAKNLPRFPIQRQGLVGLSLIFHDFPLEMSHKNVAIPPFHAAWISHAQGPGPAGGWGAS